jgi:hypothetical protein
VVLFGPCRPVVLEPPALRRPVVVGPAGARRPFEVGASGRRTGAIRSVG